jgi:hypothetical protein
MGKYSQALISEDDRKASMEMMAQNSILGNNHATSTTSLVTGGMIFFIMQLQKDTHESIMI